VRVKTLKKSLSIVLAFDSFRVGKAVINQKSNPESANEKEDMKEAFSGFFPSFQCSYDEWLVSFSRRA